MLAGSRLPWNQLSACARAGPGPRPPSARVGLGSSERERGRAFLQLLPEVSTPNLKDFTLCNRKIHSI